MNKDNSEKFCLQSNYPSTPIFAGPAAPALTSACACVEILWYADLTDGRLTESVCAAAHLPYPTVLLIFFSTSQEITLSCYFQL